MKQFICFGIILLLGASSVFAQEFAADKKAIHVSGSVAFSSSGGDLYVIGDKRLTEVNLTATFDYFIASHIFIGLPVTLHRQYQGDYNIASTLGIGGEVGCVYGKGKSQVLPYAKIGYLYSVMSSDNSMMRYEYGAVGDGVQTEIILSLGMLLLFGKHIGVNPHISYHFQQYGADEYDYYYDLNDQENPLESGNTLRFNIGLTGLLY